MLKYIWMVIQDLFLAVTFVTLIHAMCKARFGQKALAIHTVGIILGTVSSIALAIVKNTTNKIVSSRWNHKIYIFIILFTLVFLVFSLIHARAEFTAIAGAGLSFFWIFYSLPGCISYPFVFKWATATCPGFISRD